MVENSFMAKKQNILILAGSGTGKTYAAEHYKNLADIDTIDYMFKYNKKRYGELSSEELKNLVNGWIANPDEYPKGSVKKKGFTGAVNLYFGIKKAMKENIALIPLIPETFKGLPSAFKKARIILVFPEKEIFDEYAERFRARGNDENFIKVREKDHHAVWELLETEHGIETIILKKGEYLTDALTAIDFELVKYAEI